MVDIISKRDGPRREDVAARRLIAENRNTIAKLADQLSNGAYSAGRAARQAALSGRYPGLIRPDGPSRRRVSDDPKPYVRISPNRRVVLTDDETQRQLQHLGDIRWIGGRLRLVLATAENGFFAPLPQELAAQLSGLDGTPLGPDCSEETLRARLTEALGLG